MNRDDVTPIDSAGRVRSSWQALAAVALLALAASASSLGNGFALDDVHIIAANDRVHRLDEWWRLFGQTYWPPEHGASLYRPLTMLMFALQWAIGNGSPLPFHVVNVVLYVALCMAVLILGRQLMSPRASLIGACAFAVHPVHVEAVANVVGQAELWVGVLVVTALTTYLRGHDDVTRGRMRVAAICVMYALALTFKEHAIVLPGLIIAAAVLLRGENESSVGKRLRRTAPLLAGMFSIATVFVVGRTAVIGQFTGGSTAAVFQGQDYSARVFTMLKVFPEWLRLFFWPANLSANYSRPRIETATSFEMVMLPAVVAIFALAVIAARVRREHAAATYTLGFTAISLLIPSNLVVVTGFVLAERALLLPSVGVVLAAGYALHIALRSAPSLARKTLLAGAGAYLSAGVIVSMERGPVWRNNETLLRQTVLDAPSSYRAHLMLGELLTNTGNYEEGLIELAKAVSLSSSQDVFVRRFAASRFERAGMLKVAQRYYEEAAALDPSDTTFIWNTEGAETASAATVDSAISD